MENVLCSCAKCGEELGCFRNAWNGIGNTYFSPVYLPASARDGFIATNGVYRGTQNTRIENCSLQDLVCRGCGAVLGLRCDSSPEGHFLKRNQRILRLAAMSVISERTGHKAVISVVERFALTLPGTTKQPRSRRASTVQPSYRGETPNIINPRHNAPSTSAQVVEDRQEQGLEKFKDWAKSAIQAQQNDIDRINRAFDRMERDLNSFKAFMEETRAELAAHRQFRDNLKDEELAGLKRDIVGIQSELNANRQFKNSLRDEEFPVLQEDIDTLRSELSRTQNSQRELKSQDIKILQQSLDELGQKMERMTRNVEDGPQVSYDKFETLVGDVREVDRKAREVSNIRAELEQFKARLESMETSIRETVSSQRTATSTVEHTPDQAGLTSSKPYLSKRKHPQEDGQLNTRHEPPTKRPKNSKVHATSILSSGNTSSKSLTVRFHTRESPIILSSAHNTSVHEPVRPNDQSDQLGRGAIKRSKNGNLQFSDIGGDNPRPSREVETEMGLVSSTAQLSSKAPVHAMGRVIRGSVRKEDAGIHSRQEDHNISTGLNLLQKSGEWLSDAIKLSGTENLKSRYFRERSDTPDQLSTPYAEGSMRKSVQKRRPGHPPRKSRRSFGAGVIAPIDSDSPLPSIENDSGHETIQAPKPAASIDRTRTTPDVAANQQHPFACNECGKKYKFAGNLERHMVISGRCRVVKGAAGSVRKVDEDAIKKRQIKERERFATELLERQ